MELNHGNGKAENKGCVFRLLAILESNGDDAGKAPSTKRPTSREAPITKLQSEGILRALVFGYSLEVGRLEFGSFFRRLQIARWKTY